MVPAGKSLTALTIRLSSSLDQGSEDFVFSPAEVPLREKENFFISLYSETFTFSIVVIFHWLF